MSYQDLSAEQQVQKCSLEVMTHTKYRSLAGILMMGVTKVVDKDARCSTAYTDGLNKTYVRPFVESLSEPEMRFVILHEGMHVTLRHLVTWLGLFKEDATTAGQACDYVINLLLVDSDAGSGFILMPGGDNKGLYDLKYKGMDTGEVYRLLKQEGKGGGKGGFDVHGWEEAKGRTEEGTKAIEKEVAAALQQGAVLVGKLSGDMARAIGEITEPKVDWVEQMREFVVSLCAGKEMTTWRRPSRRSIDSGDYMPSSYSEAIGRVGVGVDTSGSIGGAMVSRFLSEVGGIGKLVSPELMDLLYWDSRVQGHEKYGPGQYDNLVQSTKPKGGGGTRPSCVTAYLQEKKIKPECMIMLTDGVVGSDWGGQWPCPVLWCIVGGRRVTAGTGKTIHITI
jgi:predicted metal-dependent peptidase